MGARECPRQVKQQKPVDEKYLDEAGHTGRGNEDEVLHKFVWSMYKFVLSRYTFTPVHSTKVCLVPNKGVVFEQTLFKCASFIVAF